MSVALAVVLGVIQGLTEFLPVSSSGHLVVAREFLTPYLGQITSPLAFDILVHLATGLVTAFFLRAELFAMLRGVFHSDKIGAYIRKLALLVIIATVPAVAAGLFAKDFIEKSFSSFETALNGFLITACLLECAHRRQLKVGAPVQGGLQTFDWQLPTPMQALLIGFAQACAIMPGISRSGSTIAVALILGLGPVTAVRFSFYLLLPVVAGAVVLEIPELQNLSVDAGAGMSLGFCTTMIVAYIALKFLVWLVQGAKLRYFAIYTLLLGTLLRVL